MNLARCELTMNGAAQRALNAAQQEIQELKRPWKLFSFLAGVALLILGSYVTPAPDWDIPISLIMATLTFVTAGWVVRTLVWRRFRFYPVCVLFIWICVDGCYWLYWTLVNPNVVAMMRDVNFPASLCLYFICGLIWLPKLSAADAANLLRIKREAAPRLK